MNTLERSIHRVPSGQRVLVCDTYKCRHIFTIPLNAAPAQIQTLVCPACKKSVSISKKRKD